MLRKEQQQRLNKEPYLKTLYVGCLHNQFADSVYFNFVWCAGLSWPKPTGPVPANSISGSNYSSSAQGKNAVKMVRNHIDS